MSNETNMENIANMETRPLNPDENLANMVTRPLNAEEKISTEVAEVKKEHPDTIRFRELKEKKLPTGGFQNVIDGKEYQVLLDRMTPPYVTEDEIPILQKRQNEAGLGNNPPLTETEIAKIQKISRELEFKRLKETQS